MDEKGKLTEKLGRKALSLRCKKHYDCQAAKVRNVEFAFLIAVAFWVRQFF